MTPPLSPRRIVAAVDFGDASGSAVALAGLLAEAFGASLTVLHAETMEMPPYFTEAQIEMLEAERLEARARAAGYVRTFAERFTSVATVPLVEDGPPVEAILRAATSFDLVVLGTHGRRGPRRWWLGSVAEAVVREAPVPVLVTRALEPATLHRLRGGAALVLASASGGDAAEGWAGALQDALRIVVTRTVEIGTCDPDQIRDADLVIVSLAADDGAGAFHDRVFQLLTSCSHPVLFVPAGSAVSARRFP